MRQESKVVRLDEIGLIRLKKSRKAKYLNIYVRSSRLIWAAVPNGMSTGKAETMIRAKKSWILKQQKCWREREDRTRHGISEMPEHPQERLRLELFEYAQRYGLSTRGISIRRQKTRWGSCSGSNHISLNVNILRLPADLREYVILHELMHTQVKNHGRIFWMQLEHICPQAKKRRARLRDYGWLLTASV